MVKLRLRQKGQKAPIQLRAGLQIQLGYGLQKGRLSAPRAHQQVLGLLLLVAGCALRPSLAQMLRPVTSTILGNLSLFFVPAGVGVVAHLQQFRQEGLAIAVALTVSTALAIAAGALVFKIVARWTGQDSEPGE